MVESSEIDAWDIHSILSTAARASAGRTFSVFISAKHPHKHCVGTADTFSYCYCRDRAVHRTGSAFHTEVYVVDAGLIITYGKDGMRTDVFTHAAPDAFVRIKF